MRLAAISPDELNAEQKPLYDDMSQGIRTDFKGFVNVREDGALLGPWNPWIRQPKFGKPVWELVKTMVAEPSLPAPVREVAILVTGAHFRAAYELYAHVIIADPAVFVAGIFRHANGATSGANAPTFSR
jgi:4-carboxymuconolactone decarboxylase